MSVLVAVSMIVWLAPATATAAPKSLLVPSTAYPTIRSAVEAAKSGDKIKVLPGTYREQVSIAKSLTITGSGRGVTTISAPETLVAGADGNNSVVEIRNGASVAMSLIGVSGPGAATCDKPLGAGIRVLEGAHLDLRFARVTHIRHSPTVACFRKGVGVMVGIITGPASGTAVVRDSLISDYATKGILILSAGPATITQNVITGPARLPADGIDALFSASKISFNFITGNVCPVGSTSCANDPLTGVQHFAILIGGVPGGVVTHNVASGNQVGIFGLGGDVTLNHNALLNNSDFGYELADGSFVASDDRIVGGIGGVAVLAVGADADVRLMREQIVGTSGPPVVTEQCCGFTQRPAVSRRR